MRKDEFLQRLEKALVMDGPEKEEVLRYYSEYLEDAGEENEEQAIEEIGSPEELGNHLSAEFYGEEEEAAKAEKKVGEESDVSLDDMVRELGSAVERFVRKAWYFTGAVVEEVSNRVESEWKKNEPNRSDALNKAVDEAKKAAKVGVQEAKKVAEVGVEHTRKALTSLKDILADGGVLPYEYTNFELEPFHKVKVFVKNCPVYVHASTNGCFGADVRLNVRGEEEAAVLVQNDTLVVESTAANGIGRRSGCTPGFSGQEVNLYLPEGVYESIEIITSNARIELEDLKLDDAVVQLKTGNGKIKVTNCEIGSSLQAETGNMPVELDKVTAPTAVLYTVNAAVRVDGGSIGVLDAGSSNGPVIVDGCEVKRKLTAETANGPIKLVLNEEAEAYRVSADTSNASVWIDGKKIGAHYEAPGRIPVKANTDNGRIELNFAQPPFIYEAEEEGESEVSGTPTDTEETE